MATATATRKRKNGRNGAEVGVVEARLNSVRADLDALQSLVDKSLLRRRGERYRMLDSIREYALEKLEFSVIFQSSDKSPVNTSLEEAVSNALAELEG